MRSEDPSSTLRQRQAGRPITLGDACSPDFTQADRAGKRAGVLIGNGFFAQQQASKSSVIRWEATLQMLIDLGLALQSQEVAPPPPPSVVELVRYIHGEMVANEAGSEVREMRRLLKVDFMDVLIAGKQSTDILAVYFRWYQLVKSGGPWDHKAEILSRFGTWSGDYENQREFRFDIWSNLHYGYIGRAIGLPRWDLLAGAGVAQWKAGNAPSGYWERRFEELGDADFLAALDDPLDQEAIKLGFDLWEQNGNALTFDQVLDAVRIRWHRLATRPMSR